MVKGAAGAAVLAVGGYFGAAFMQVISAPKDSVAYDLIQSMTGMLKPPPAPSTPPAPSAPPTAPKASADERTQIAAAPAAPARMAAPAPVTLPPAALSAGPTTPSLPSLSTLSARAAAPTSRAETKAGPSASEAPAPGSMLDRVQKTTQLAKQAMANTAALANSRVLTVADSAEAAICGGAYALEVSSVAPNAGRVALVGPDGAPIILAVGEPPRVLAGGCRVVLLSTMEDLMNRRAQLREIVPR